MPPPVVSGISPKEGPPGTALTIRGENLGTSLQDLVSVVICGQEMVLAAEWISTSKIIARAGSEPGIGDIIVTTSSGGVGTSSVQFRVEQVLQVHAKKESALYVDESHTFLTAWDKHRPILEELPSDNILNIADEGQDKKKKPSGRLRELFPNQSGSVTAPNFSPYWYLLENHQNSSFEELKAGLRHAEAHSSMANSEPTSYLKTNLGTFMDCQDSLVKVHNMLISDENCKAIPVETLSLLLQAADKDADSLFHDIIRRKEKADSTRNALTILHRFKFLFYLPSTIKKRISRGEYEVVINDYIRAKLLFKDKKVAVFQRVFAEVEKEIEKFRKFLQAKLTENPSKFEEKRKLIRHLVDLEYNGNAAWECICAQHAWLLEKFTNCNNQHTGIELDEVEMGKKKKPLMIRPSIATNDQIVKSAVDPVGSGGHSDDSQTRIPQRIIFLQELSALLQEHFPSLGKLGHYYFEDVVSRKDGMDQHPRHKAEQNQQLQQFKDMLSQVLRHYCQLVSAAFLPGSKVEKAVRDVELREWTVKITDISSDWLPNCVRLVNDCAEAIKHDMPYSLDSASLLEQLVLDLKSLSMKTILNQAVDDVKRLSSKENWILETSEDGSRTQLPRLFENCIIGAIKNLNEVGTKVKISDKENTIDATTQELATKLCIDIVKAFIDALENTAEETPSDQLGSLDSISQSESANMGIQRRLVVTLSNCNYTSEKTLARVVEEFDKLGYQNTTRILHDSEDLLNDLFGKLFDRYVSHKVDPIIGALEELMYKGGFDWSSSKEPVSVQNYVKAAIANAVEVHAEIYSILPARIVSRIMEEVVTNIGQEISRLMSAIPKLNKHGAMQARLDILAFRQATEAYMSQDAWDETERALEQVHNMACKDETKLLDDFFKRSALNILVLSSRA